MYSQTSKKSIPASTKSIPASKSIPVSDLEKRFAKAPSVAALSRLLSDSKCRRFALTGLAGSSLAMLLTCCRRSKHPVVIVADDVDDAGYIYSDLVRLSRNPDAVQILPSGYKRGIRYGQPDPPSVILRTEALGALAAPESPLRWLVTYPEALVEKVPCAGKIADATLRVRIGDKLLPGDLTARLPELGFVKTDYVYEPGQFARRGSIVDIYSYAFELPYRIDFFDDEVDSIRTFNVETQLSEQKCDGVEIVGALQDEAADEEVSLPEFLHPDTVVICRDEQRVLAVVKESAGDGLSESVVLSGEGDASAMKHAVDPDRFAKAWESLRIATASYAPSVDATADAELPEPSAEEPLPAAEGAATVRFSFRPQGLYHKNFDLLAQSLSRFIEQGYSIYILSDSREQARRLETIFADRGDRIPFTAVEGTLHEGFSDASLKLCCFTDHQIFDRFHNYTLRSAKARSGRLAMTLQELSQIRTGDYIVHIDHGVGRFAGLVRVPGPGNNLQEMIKLVYAGDDIIFVSIHALHKLSKYRGQEGEAPRLNKLGSGAWNRIKERTKSKMKDIARDLIRLYAARLQQKGFAFSPDTYLQHELEASFAYEDTPDQLLATRAVKADMEARRPMDRLVCGDVGFGKTEIAIRAAFKAAADGKQTAVLVPTTVLALQHYHTFTERLREMPVRVEFLSRARSAKETRDILADLAEGRIDIIIGTHKLIGKSVKFKDLGLLVVDEEQKFGVAVKEKLRQLRTGVDTLTLTATPIPRTLQFSLMGARDMSNLLTPPQNRRPIVTRTGLATDDIISEAVNFEISRGGQTFMLCNRIEHHATLMNMLQRLLPGIRVVQAHGQMPPAQLEKAVTDFAAGKYDLLLCTTIIESGIDMPNVNTIIVTDAQNYGLSALHQLRGRVGRSDRRAFCYLLTPPGLKLTPQAQRRLDAIESFTDLGSGIHIAMQDLDIRGAGNLLGAEQSGFIADLGYEAYQKILRQAVTELKTEEFPDLPTAGEEPDADRASEDSFVADCTVETDLELLIPPEYVPNESQRIALYQELDNLPGTQQALDAFRSRLRDRFGAIPGRTEELISIVPLRSAARSLGIERLYLKQGRMYLHFVGEENKAYYQSRAFGRVLSWAQANPRRSQFRQKDKSRSIVVSQVATVAEALSILTAISTLPVAGEKQPQAAS